MLRFQQIKDGFEIYFKNKLFFTHHPSNPCVSIGMGSIKFKDRFGSFKIKKKVRNRYQLTGYTLIEESNEKIRLTFYLESDKEVSLDLELVTIRDNLIIIPSCSNPEINQFWIKITANSNEAIFGCGEQFSELNLRGKNVPLWSEEQGILRGDPKVLSWILNIVGIAGHWYSTYYPQPTYLSTDNYFLHSESSCYAEFDFRNRNYHELHFWGVPERIAIAKQDDLIKTVSELSSFLGRQPKLPEWAYDGVWLGIQGGNEIVDKKLSKCEEADVKVTGVWCQDWEGIRMTKMGKRLFWDWKYDDKIYPDLPDYIKKLSNQGIRYLGYINSFLAMDGDLYKEASKKGYCIKDLKGNDYKVQTGNGESTMIDLSNPKAIEWLKEVVKKNMIDIGLSGWMADFGEYLPVDAVLHSGEDAKEFHNKYPTIWAKAMHDALEESGKLGEIIFFTRSGYSNTSRYTTLVWAGDQIVDWSMDDGLASVIPAGLSLGLQGIGYFHSDIGGYTTFLRFKREKELFMRWAEQSAFTMVMRSHEGNMPDKNIQFDEDDELLEHFAKMSKIHVLLKPYKIALSKEYQQTGISPMRPCFLHYPADKTLLDLKYQYLFGKELLVAPVIKPNRTRWKVYFPDDVWIHVWSEKEYQSGWNTVEAPLGQPPVFYRKTSEYMELFKKMKEL